MEAALFVGAGLVLLALGIVVIARGRPREDGVDPFAREISEPAFEPILIGSLDDLRERFGRAAFLPEVVPGQAEGARSHLAGRPWLAQGEPWPTCSPCGSPLQLLLQLDLDALPDGGPPQRSGGLLQLFACTRAGARCELDPVAGAGSSLARVIDAAPDSGGAVAPADHAPAPPLAPRTIVGWSERLDLPASAEWEALSVHAPAEEALVLALAEAELPVRGDKLGGWPRWAPGESWASYPPCPECGAAMELVFQLVGDGVGGRLMRCPTHSRVVTFDRERR